MVGGEVYVETVPADRGFTIETPHGRVIDLGTRFGVDAELHGTTVVVVEGRVEAATDAGSVEVGEGREVRLARRTSPPEEVREAHDLERRLAWAEASGLAKGPVREVVFRDGFDGSPVGEWPEGWLRHETSPESRSGFVVLEDAERPGDRCVACRNHSPNTTQHALVPVAEWPDRFVLRLRMRIEGRGSSRAGFEVWSTAKRAFSVELDAGASSLGFGEHRGRGWRIVEKAPLDLPASEWRAIELAFVGDRVAVSFDGKALFARPHGLTSGVGRVSLISKGVDSAGFDDVEVVRLPEGARLRGTVR
jgi:hypothetical protein